MQSKLSWLHILCQIPFVKYRRVQHCKKSIKMHSCTSNKKNPKQLSIFFPHEVTRCLWFSPTGGSHTSLFLTVAVGEKSSHAYKIFQREQSKKKKFLFPPNTTNLQRFVRFFYIFYFQL